MIPEGVVARLRELLRWDEIHAKDCATAMPPPGPFPCDCEVPSLLTAVLAEPTTTGRTAVRA